MLRRVTGRTVSVAPTAYAAAVVTLAFGYLKWLAGVEAPAEIIVGTVGAVSVPVGWVWPDGA